MNTEQTRSMIRPTQSAHAPETPRAARLASLALAATLTLATLLGIHALAAHESEAPQMAQIKAPQA